MCTFLYRMENCGIWNRCILGLWNWSIADRCDCARWLWNSLPGSSPGHWRSQWLPRHTPIEEVRYFNGRLLSKVKGAHSNHSLFDLKRPIGSSQLMRQGSKKQNQFNLSISLMVVTLQPQPASLWACKVKCQDSGPGNLTCTRHLWYILVIADTNDIYSADTSDIYWM